MKLSKGKHAVHDLARDSTVRKQLELDLLERSDVVALYEPEPQHAHSVSLLDLREVQPHPGRDSYWRKSAREAALPSPILQQIRVTLSVDRAVQWQCQYHWTGWGSQEIVLQVP